jgi:hypothetical protein
LRFAFIKLFCDILDASIAVGLINSVEVVLCIVLDLTALIELLIQKLVQLKITYQANVIIDGLLCLVYMIDKHVLKEVSLHHRGSSLSAR